MPQASYEFKLPQQHCWEHVIELKYHFNPWLAISDCSLLESRAVNRWTFCLIHPGCSWVCFEAGEIGIDRCLVVHTNSWCLQFPPFRGVLFKNTTFEIQPATTKTVQELFASAHAQLTHSSCIAWWHSYNLVTDFTLSLQNRLVFHHH